MLAVFVALVIAGSAHAQSNAVPASPPPTPGAIVPTFDVDAISQLPQNYRIDPSLGAYPEWIVEVPMELAAPPAVPLPDANPPFQMTVNGSLSLDTAIYRISEPGAHFAGSGKNDWLEGERISLDAQIAPNVELYISFQGAMSGPFPGNR
jgi:hypothetical protein